MHKHVMEYTDAGCDGDVGGRRMRNMQQLRGYLSTVLQVWLCDGSIYQLDLPCIGYDHRENIVVRRTADPRVHTIDIQPAATTIPVCREHMLLDGTQGSLRIGEYHPFAGDGTVAQHIPQSRLQHCQSATASSRGVEVSMRGGLGRSSFFIPVWMGWTG